MLLCMQLEGAAQKPQQNRLSLLCRSAGLCCAQHFTSLRGASASREYKTLACPLPLHSCPDPQQWASLEHKAWMEREAGQEPVAALSRVTGGEGAV